MDWLATGRAGDASRMVPVFRFAPSPNGYLHLGHAYSALLNAQMAAEQGGRFLLRIEDTDTMRCSSALAACILEDLAWLGLSWEEPVRRQSEHLADYEAALRMLWDRGLIYPCFCSRRQAPRLSSVDPDGQPHYAGVCRSVPVPVARQRIAAGQPHGWRLDSSRPEAQLASEWGDVMIAKPRTGSSYHIAVVVDDFLQGVTHVVRGRDLAAATSIHKVLQRYLGLPTPLYFHHDLITDGTGQKLSKSAGSRSLRQLRQSGITPADIRQWLGFGSTQKSLAMPLRSQSP